MESQQDHHKNIVTDLVQASLKSGADSAEVMCVHGTDQSIEVRNGEIENSDFSESKTIGIRVLVGQQAATVSGSDFSAKGLQEMVERAVTSAKILPSDPYAQIAPTDQLFQKYKAIEGICDANTPELTDLQQQAFEAESAALSLDGITNSEGAGCSFGRYQILLATSNGFCGHYEKTLAGISCSVLAGEGVNMQRDYSYSTHCLYDNLKSAKLIGLKAAHRTLKKLNPVKMKSGNFPVIFDKRVGRSFLGYFANAISADAISRGVSFLGNELGQAIFAPNIQIVDDPHLVGGLASVPFDAEGVYNPALNIIENGVLKSFLSHGASSRKMNIVNNGRASRSPGGNPYPSATNMYLKAGTVSPTELYDSVKYGFYVTETIGHGLNDVTGDYSIGASGFLIENGEVTIPISEVTIAGNLKDIFKSMVPADDLVFLSRKNIPTIRVDSLTIAGE
ncbi:MAG: PmbA protein [Alphaproteobacteria bacterium]|jgi:PmbA protein